MNDATRAALAPLWERNPDLCDVVASAIERREGWDAVAKLWGRTPPMYAWRAYHAAWQAEYG